MNISIDVNCPDLVEAINNLAAAMGNRQLQAPPVEKSRDVVKPAAKKAATPATSDQSEEAGQEAEAEAPPEKAKSKPASSSKPESSDDAIVYAHVKAAVMKVSTTKGRQAAVDLLAEFEAKVGGDLTEAQWPKFVARAEEVLA